MEEVELVSEHAEQFPGKIKYTPPTAHSNQIQLFHDSGR